MITHLIASLKTGWRERALFPILVFLLTAFTPSPLEATRLVSYYFRGETRLGAWTKEGIIDLNRSYREMLKEKGVPRAEERANVLVPPQMLEFLQGDRDSMAAAMEAIAWVQSQRAESKRRGLSEVAGLTGLGVWFDLKEVTLKAAIPKPPHLLAVALNYRSHSDEIKIDLPKFPNVFTNEGKVIGPGEPIEIPEAVGETDYEGELAVVIGTKARNVARASAYDYVAGYMTFNDVTARDLQFRVSQYTLGKSPDTFSAMGPFLVLKDEVPNPHNLRLTTRLGTEIVQDSSTSHMIFTVPDLIAEISRVMTLEPGTVIATGTPSGVGFARKPPRFLKPGETILFAKTDRSGHTPRD
ncbi:MAG: fumarylacetoacetate hydrolase family protein [Acidobacteria bacterium]|nr:fumarylacetoacetate hydrolase family protein [Acidobacteriota bacterium]MCI0718796.1 fumarylacetoacetate hydrolase family protein [Acidobacteriota bacterium]